MKSMYIIVEANNMANAKARVKTIMDAKGYPDNFYKFLIGENNTGKANGKIIKNNIMLTDWGNGNFCFEVDRNIVEQYGDEISEEIAKYSDIHWCSAEEVRPFMPEIDL